VIQRVLVANRGEIARRVFATCRRLGIETVAVYSDADSQLPFVREADVAVRLPGDTPAETYLRGELILEAARRTGADAVHPGYGFLSESADFARQVIQAGLTWIGPAPDSIEQMGSKIESKLLMAKADVPVLENLSPETATAADLPLLVKASAGGGGRGMRVVRRLVDLPAEIALATEEARSAFGDGTVFVEPYVERGRHIEVQVIGDRWGGVHVLGERDCSLQRRHQKVVEEAPAPDIDDAVVAALHDAARKAAEAISYVGAGTVEFLYDVERERFFFLEMNTRLQVEHPVTEAITGVDLVELQVRVAEGAALDLEAPTIRGHAIEVRLYAEDPTNDWQPQSGVLHSFEIPGVVTEFERTPATGVRLDSGFEAGSTVSTFYDAMLAKVIAWAPTRIEAARVLAHALSRAKLRGVVTNRDLLVETLRHQDFLAGAVSTDFFDRTAVVAASAPAAPSETTLFAAAVAVAEDARARRTVQRGVPVAWRNVVSQPQRTVFRAEDGDHTLEWYADRDGYRLARGDVRVLAASSSEVTLEVDRVSARYAVAIGEPDASGTRPVWVDGPTRAVSLREVPRFVDPAEQVAAGSLLAPMPGTVIGVPVESGAAVASGDTLLVLEAMKMQHAIRSPADGVVEVVVRVGQQVSAGDVLAVVSAGSSTEETDQ
jgi:propionyl-CoA carboxylase alpha chain